jgi:hypothetical protein
VLGKTIGFVCIRQVYYTGPGAQRGQGVIASFGMTGWDTAAVAQSEHVNGCIIVVECGIRCSRPHLGNAGSNSHGAVLGGDLPGLAAWMQVSMTRWRVTVGEA